MRGGRKLALAWVVWAIGVAAAVGFVLWRGWHTNPTESGIEFFEVHVSHLVLGYFMMLCTGVVACFAPAKDRAVPWMICAALSVAIWFIVWHVLQDREFEVTPPCWGVHSSDPGSGQGCRPGMRPDMTREELREYHRIRSAGR